MNRLLAVALILSIITASAVTIYLVPQAAPLRQLLAVQSTPVVFQGTFHTGYATMGCVPNPQQGPCAVIQIALLTSYLTFGGGSYLIQWASTTPPTVTEGSTIAVSGALLTVDYSTAPGSTYPIYRFNNGTLLNPQPTIRITNAVLVSTSTQTETFCYSSGAPNNGMVPCTTSQTSNQSIYKVSPPPNPIIDPILNFLSGIWNWFSCLLGYCTHATTFSVIGTFQIVYAPCPANVQCNPQYQLVGTDGNTYQLIFTLPECPVGVACANSFQIPNQGERIRVEGTFTSSTAICNQVAITGSNQQVVPCQPIGTITVSSWFPNGV